MHSLYAVRKRTAFLFIAAITLLTLGLACSDSEDVPPSPSPTPTSTPASTTESIGFDELFNAPEKYNGREIQIEGFYFHGFETIVLSEKLEYSGYAEGHLVPKGRLMWVEGGIPKEIYDVLLIQDMMGPTERYGRVMITGKFQQGGQYGHLGAFNVEIVPAKVQLLAWSPQVK